MDCLVNQKTLYTRHWHAPSSHLHLKDPLLPLSSSVIHLNSLYSILHLSLSVSRAIQQAIFFCLVSAKSFAHLWGQHEIRPAIAKFVILSYFSQYNCYVMMANKIAWKTMLWPQFYKVTFHNLNLNLPHFIILIKITQRKLQSRT